MGRKILIVDDEVSIHSSLHYVLRQYDLEIFHAITGDDAITIVHDHKPDIILMDFKLPGKNGIEVTRIIKGMEGMASIPIIGITAYATEENLNIAKENGIEYVLEKPFDLIELQKLINKYIVV